jgi:hypothetical protein
VTPLEYGDGNIHIHRKKYSSGWKSENGKGYYKIPKAGTEYTATSYSALKRN